MNTHAFLSLFIPILFIPSMYASQAQPCQICEEQVMSSSAVHSISTSSIVSHSAAALAISKIVCPRPERRSTKNWSRLASYKEQVDSTSVTESAQTIVSQNGAQLSAKQLFRLGEQFRTGTGAEKNEKVAIDYYIKAVQKKSLAAFHALCTHFTTSSDVKIFVDTTITDLRRLAEQGDASAQYSLGIFYEKGVGVEQNFNTAATFYQHAADQNHATALNNLARLYVEGNGVTQNFAKAVELYEKAIERSNIATLTNTALTNLIQLCQRAGTKEASYLCNLGVRYWEGLGVEQSTANALTLMTAAAEQKIPEAQYNLGIACQSGLKTTNAIQSALYYFNEAAKHKYPLAQQALGIFYYNGIGVEKDQKKAFELFELAAAQNSLNCALAEQSVGVCSLYGEGTKTDLKKAADYFVRAADHGLLEAQVIAYTLFQRGIFFAQNTKRAAHYFEEIQKAGGSKEMAYIVLQECPNLEEAFQSSASKSSLPQRLRSNSF